MGVGPSVGVALTARPIFETYTPLKLPHPPQCVDSALKGKRVCRTHGMRSTSRKTEAGQQRCAKQRPFMEEGPARREANAAKLVQVWQ